MLRKYKIYIAIIAILCMASTVGLIITVNQFSPYEQVAISLGTLYTSLFAFITTLACLIGFGIRRRFGMREMLALQFRQSLRQGILLGLIAVAMLVLQSLRMASLINSGLLIAALCFLEFYFISKERQTL